jgi:hypothetical protein
MKTSIFTSIILGAFVSIAAERKPWTHLNFQNDPEDFRFAIIPDRSGGDFRGAFTNALNLVNWMRPEFVMTVGDLVQGVTTPDRLRNQQIELTNFASKVIAPFFYVVGNHDITRSRPAYPLHHEDSSKVWREFYGDKTYYSFTYKRCLFMAVDTMSGRDSRPNQCALTPEQLDWIRKTLKENADVRWTFIFMHQPAVWDSAHWKNLEKNELAGRKYTVFAGDWHEYVYAKRHGREYYALSVAGGCSANNSKNRSELMGLEYGEFDHITWVTMQKDGPTVVNLKLDGIVPGNYLTQKTTKSEVYHPVVDIPSDPKVVEKMQVLKIKKDAVKSKKANATKEKRNK